MAIENGPIEYCSECPVGCGDNGPVRYRGPVDAEIVVLGQAPGKMEVEDCTTFIGPAGKLLTDALEEFGFNTSKILFINPVLCQPKGDAKPSNKVVNACKEISHKIITHHPRKLIICCGSVAMYAAEVTTASTGVEKMAGTIKDSPYYGCPALVTLHPASALYKRSQLYTIKSDLRLARKFLDGKAVGEINPNITDITLENIDEAFNTILNTPIVAWDTETYPDQTPFCIGFAISEDEAFYLDLRRWNKKDENAKMLEQLVRFANHSGTLVAHNAAFDHYAMEYRLDIPIKAKFRDTMIGAHLLDEERLTGLNKLVTSIFCVNDWKDPINDYFQDIEEETDAEDRNTRDYSTIPLQLVRPYVCQDAAATFKLDAYVEPKMTDELKELRNKIDQPASWVLMKASGRGILVDKELKDEIEQHLEVEVDKLLTRLKNEVGTLEVGGIKNGEPIVKVEEFNPRSNKHMQVLIYGKMGAPVITKTKSGQPSVSSDDVIVPLYQRQLHIFGEPNPVLSDILSYKTADKNLNTFIRGKKAGINTHIESDDRVHPGYSVARLVTGRSSAFRPNLQQTPPGIQCLFIPDYGYKFLYADYSQAELRMLAVFSQDPVLIENLSTGDIHKATASAAFHIPFEEVTEEQRRQAKAVVFGVVYGETEMALAARLGITEREAKELQETVMSPYKRAQMWLDSIENQVMTPPHEIVGLFGRKRRLSHAARGGKFSARAARQGINAPIQSGAGDLLKLSMVQIDKWLVNKGYDCGKLDDIAWVILEIHDMVMVQCQDAYVDELSQAMKSIMEVKVNGIEFPVKIEVKDRLHEYDINLLTTHKRLVE